MLPVGSHRPKILHERGVCVCLSQVHGKHPEGNEWATPTERIEVNSTALLGITDNSPMISTTSSTVEMVRQEKLDRNADIIEGKCFIFLFM